VKLITVAGPPSVGKTAVILKTIIELQGMDVSAGVVKFDCLTTDDDERYARAGIPVQKGLSGSICPDHYFASNIEETFAWGIRQSVPILFTESAGLCNRCSPHIRDVMAVAVIDNLSGINTPRKVGPMLRTADVVVITKGDVVSQAEREVFAARVRQANQKARILPVNGLSGQGAFELARLLRDEAPEQVGVTGSRLRYPMPSAVCSYCLGEQRIGAEHQIGNVTQLSLSDISINSTGYHHEFHLSYQQPC
jgi:Ni2+-binding GTPase involved in maturation of urease and hydrogenase